MDLGSLMGGNTQVPQTQSFTSASVSNALSLSKGQTLSINSLVKEPSGLQNIQVGLGWERLSQNVDLDCEVFGLTNNGKVLNQGWFIFYGQLNSPDSSIQHQGDNRTGEGANDDESIKVNLNSINPAINKLVFTVTIDEALSKAQHFGMVSNAYIRIVDSISNKEILRYNLTDNYNGQTALIVGEIVRKGNTWNFNALGQGMQCDLYSLCGQYGVNVK